MKIKTKKQFKKKTIISVVILLALFIGGVVYVLGFQGSILGWPNHQVALDPNINYDKPTDEQKKAGDATKESRINDNNPSKPNEFEDPLPSPTPQVTGKSRIDMIITAVNQTGSTLQVRSEIATVSNTGHCTLKLSNSTQSVTKTAPVQALPSSSTCQGFDIPTNELSNGSWELSLFFENETLLADTKGSVVIR